MEFSFLSAEVESHLEPFFQCVFIGGIDGVTLSIQSAAMPTAVACQRNRLVVPMSGSFNASSRRMLIVRFVLDMFTSIVMLDCSCNELRDFVSFVLLLLIPRVDPSAAVHLLLHELFLTGSVRVAEQVVLEVDSLPCQPLLAAAGRSTRFGALLSGSRFYFRSFSLARFSACLRGAATGSSTCPVCFCYRAGRPCCL